MLSGMLPKMNFKALIIRHFVPPCFYDNFLIMHFMLHIKKVKSRQQLFNLISHIVKSGIFMIEYKIMLGSIL